MVQQYNYFRTLPPASYPEALAALYESKTSQHLNLENPQTYDEKIQWLKLYDATPEKARLADKYLVREWVRERIGEQYLVPLLGVWDSFDEIDFDALPDRFVLKANHGCGWNVIVPHKALLDREAAKYNFDRWMQTNFALVSLELHYAAIQPRIIAEAYLENSGEDLYDYKVFCFDGKAKYIMFLSERHTGLKMAFFDLDWNKLDITYNYPKNEDDIPRPQNLDLLISLSERLAEGLPHVRVDFYILNDGSLVFGEMTLSSASGFCIWNPPEQDRIMGELIHLPAQKRPLPDKSFAERGFPALPEDFRKRETNYREQARKNTEAFERIRQQRDELNSKLRFANERRKDFYELSLRRRDQLDELNGKLRQAYADKSELNAKLKQAREKSAAEKAELNAKLKQTYAEKSELNAKLKKTYQEKSDRGVEIKALKAELGQTQAELAQTQAQLAKTQAELQDTQSKLKSARKALKEAKSTLGYRIQRKLTGGKK